MNLHGQSKRAQQLLNSHKSNEQPWLIAHIAKEKGLDARCSELEILEAMETRILEALKLTDDEL